ncbi:MAG: DNA translocase FtsK, partial [Candidatus Cloacimonetes bacterium]|nr:DNA translocase FtsK [Candidatus Cloacimonadota bacterium]
MAKAKKKPAKKTKKQPAGLSHTQKRLISAAISLISLLVIISLLMGYQSISRDMQALAENGNIFSWFGSHSADTANPIGVFGILFGYAFIYIFGYWLSLIGFIIIGGVSFQYFVDPELKASRQKGYLLIIALFFLQSLLSARLPGYSQSVLPLALYRVLAAVFHDIGAKIILIGSIVLSLLAIFELSRIRHWLGLLTREITPKEKPSKPTIDKDPIIADPKPTEPAPSISDHMERDIPIVQRTEPKIVSEGPKPKVHIADEDDFRPYQMPSVEDFLESPVKLSEKDRKEIETQILSTSSILKNKLAEFGIEAEVRNVNIGPIITQYELEPAKGVKVSKFASLADDLALAIKAKSIRIQAPIPGRGLIGIEIPNLTRDMIYLKDLLLCEDMHKSKSKLAFGLGKDISGRPIVADLSRMPHLLIAGATGSGKSVCINTILMSLIMRTTPDDLRLILIDPKRVELAGYAELPHLIGDVVTDPDTALETMYWAVKEMERRYELLQEAKVRDI